MGEMLIFLFIMCVIGIGLFLISDMPKVGEELERSRKELEEEMKSLCEEIEDGRDKEVVDEVNDEDWDETREEARALVFNPYLPVPPPYPTQKQGKLIPLRCTNCGGVLNPDTLTCEYCHTPHTII